LAAFADDLRPWQGIVSVQVATQYSLVPLDVALIGVAGAVSAGAAAVATPKGDTVQQLECRLPVARSIWVSRVPVGCVDALGDTDFDSLIAQACGRGESVLKVQKRLAPV